jgi:hypothetical protein
MSCEDQACPATKTCTQCVTGFTRSGKSIYPGLVKRGQFWCCPKCGASYGEHPHPDLK